jgi:environmental stress-induced protein Ves
VIRLLRAADRVAMPWKNGGGITREVAISPENASFDNFDWRISIADVREAGPFSTFENIDRVMMILKGRLALAFPGCTVELDPTSGPFAFRGEESCFGTPLDGGVTDLNVMVRRGKSSAQVSRVVGQTRISSAGLSILVAPTATVVEINSQRFSLEAQDALTIPREARIVSTEYPAFLIVLF